MQGFDTILPLPLLIAFVSCFRGICRKYSEGPASHGYQTASGLTLLLEISHRPRSTVGIYHTCKPSHQLLLPQPNCWVMDHGAPVFLSQASLLSYTARTVRCWQLNPQTESNQCCHCRCLSDSPTATFQQSGSCYIHTYGLWRLQLLEKVIFGTIKLNRIWNSFWTFILANSTTSRFLAIHW